MKHHEHRYQGLYFHGLRFDLQHSDLKQEIFELICSFGVNMRKNNISVISKTKNVFAFVNLHSQDIVDVLLQCLETTESRSRLKYDFSKIFCMNSNFYIAQIKKPRHKHNLHNKILPGDNDFSNNGLAERVTMDTGTSAPNLDISGLAERVSMDTQTSALSMATSQKSNGLPLSEKATVDTTNMAVSTGPVDKIKMDSGTSALSIATSHKRNGLPLSEEVIVANAPVSHKSIGPVEKITMDSGTSALNIVTSRKSILVQVKGVALDAATSVSGLTPATSRTQNKFYYYNDKLGSETRNVEFKEGKGNYKHNVMSEHVGKYVCGFVNSLQGGTLFMGVNDRGMVQGVVCSHEEEDHLRLRIDEAIKLIEPSVFPNMYSVAFTPVLNKGSFSENLKVIEVAVHPCETSDELYEFKGGVFVRRDGSIQSLKPRDIKAWARKKAADELAQNNDMKKQLQEVTNQLQELQLQLIQQKSKKTKVCRIL